ncbi:hypothetical protein V494_05818 [Pseudogymnoascus sp. VKM F-4513 (FW-928)]|nr:hypothetical protein V494_05818 [Pseudogymnoascus sp. VKM F-4513 (FW-928)]
MPPKRKRSERGSVDSGENRPSPHRPGNTNLGGGQGREVDMRGEGGRGRGRGRGRGGRGGGNLSRRESTESFTNSPSTPGRGQGAMSPPPRPTPTPSQQQPQPPALAPTPFAASPAKSPTPEPMNDPSPYDYSHVTDERIAAWKASGRQEIVAAGAQSLDDLDILDLSTIFQELIRSGVDGRLSPVDAGSCVRDIVKPDTAPETQQDDKIDGASLFLDSLSIVTDNEEYQPRLRKLVAATGISPVLMRQMLDTQLLQNLELTRDTFFKAGIRQVTNLLYRQANHNLLREETEGYSKLVTELFTTSGGEPPTSEVVEETFERIKGLIGTFDLDAGRVLDVTMDVFAAVLIKHYRFFIKLLRVSSWWPRDNILPGVVTENADLPKWALPGASGVIPADDEKSSDEKREEELDKDARDEAFWVRAREIGIDAFYELGGRRAVDPKTKERLAASKANTDEQSNADRQWIEATGTFPPLGNQVAAQLLGFKLRFYTSPAREKDDILPANLMYLTALLIKIGFISLRDLYPHLYPLDEDMEALRAKKMKEIAEKEKLNRPGGGANALMMAGALADDTIPGGGRMRDIPGSKPDAGTPVEAEEDKDKLPEPADQKVLLLVNLLTIGAIPESLFLLGRFPWIPEAYPEVLDLLHRILHHSVDKVFRSTKPSNADEVVLPMKKLADQDQSRVPKGEVRRVASTPRKALRWPFPAKADVGDGISYKFYWDEWTDSIPVCQTVDDVFTLCSTLLNYSGVSIGRDCALLSKLASIGNQSLSKDTSEANLARWQDLLKRLLVPALSHTSANTNVANEIYDMLRYYPSPLRYNIYAEWFEGQTSRLPAMTAVFTRARLETLSTMKRISKTNLTAMAWALAKTAYANPGIVFKVALDQIESYSNLTEVVVECARYFTDLGYDVLIWSLMSSLGGKTRSRTRDDSALLTSKWLIALSNFSGKVFKRYSIMNPAPILQYVNDQLYRGNSTDLIILQEFIAQMSGVVPDTDFTDPQLYAMTGGEVLRRQTLISLQDKRFESVKTAKRLMKSLTETRLAGQLLISIAQHRQAAIFSVPEDEAHIKYLSTMVDDAQRILTQFNDLLRSNLSVDEFDNLVPDTCELMVDFGLDPALAFAIGRPSFAYKMAGVGAAELPKEITDTNGVPAVTDIDGDIGMDATAADDDVDMVKTPGSGTADEPASASEDPWLEVLAPLIESVRVALPDKPWGLLNPEFYVTFWQLSLSDIQVPMDSYTIENARLTKEMAEIMKDRSDMTRPGMIRKEEARKAVEATKEELLNESKDQMSQFGRNRSRLNKEKGKWFSNVNKRYDALNDTLLEECFLPRLLLSPSDADYAFKMVKFLHNSSTPHFRTLGLLARLFRGNRLRSIIFSCTIREAECFGRFLKLILGDLARWHASKTIYEKEAWGPNQDLPGFAKSLHETTSKPVALLEFEDFRRIFFGWHKNLNIALKSCLAGTEWMHIRNSITVLKAVVEHFPAVDFMGKAFQNALVTLAKREEGKREDLSLLANASMPELKKREKKWVMPQAFAINLGESNQANGQAKTAKGGSPQVDGKSKLKPTAPEFNPTSKISSNGKPERKRKAGEVEDGEVDDARAAKAAATGGPVASEANATPLPPRQGSLPKVPATSERQTGPPPRPDFIRGAANQDRPPSRPPSNLPTRPEVPIPHVHPERNLPARGAGRRDAHQPRADYPADSSRWPRDGSGHDRRSLDARGLERPSDRPPFDRDGHRDRVDPLRRGAEFFPGDRDRGRPPLDARGSDVNGRPSREDVVPPSRSAPPQADQGSALADPAVNPARAALISAGSDTARSGSPRGFADDRSRPRAQSPRRSDRHGGPDRDVDVRRGDRIPGDRDANQVPPFPSRDSDRAAERSRDAFQPTAAPKRPIDLDHGRLNSAGRQGESSFGRLNPSSPPLQDVPSGPRTSYGRGGSNRQASSNMSRSDTRQQGPPRPPTPDNAPPSGPAGDRSQSGTANAVPVHPERMRHLGQDTQAQGTQAAPAPPANAAPEGVHPSRMRGFQETPSLPGATQSPQQSGNVRQESSQLSSGTPSGPRGQQTGPSTPTSASSNVPTGPSFPPVDRVRGPMRQLAGINSTLQQAGQTERPKTFDRPNDRNINVRGRGGASSSAMSGFPSSGPSTPSNAPRPDTRDGGQGRGMGAPEPSPGDQFANRFSQGTGDERPDGRSSSTRDSGRHERSGRSSHRASRSHSRDRSHKENIPGPDPRAEMMGERPDFRGSGRRDGERESSRRTSGRSGPSTPGEGRERESRREGRDADKRGDGGAAMRGEQGFSRGQGYPPQPQGGHMPPSTRGEGGRSRGSRSSRGGADERRESRNSRDDGTGSIGKRRGEDRGGQDRGRDKRARQA